MTSIIKNKLAFVLAVLVFLSGGTQVVNAAPGGKDHGGKVSRALFATKMDQREPVDDVVFIDDSTAEIFFFSEILYMTGHKVIHRWEYEGKEVSRVSFDIGGPRWRVFSRKKLSEQQKGKWTVMVTDGKGWPLTAKMFVYGAEYKNKHLDMILHGQQDDNSADKTKSLESPQLQQETVSLENDESEEKIEVTNKEKQQQN